MLLDEDGHAVGTADKAEVHHADTPLHLAFSCYVLDEPGRLLVTRRARRKATFAGVWTNSGCGHPAPGERSRTPCAAGSGRSSGSTLDDLRLVLPAFRYRAVMETGSSRTRCARCSWPPRRTRCAPTPEVEVDDLGDWASSAPACSTGPATYRPWCLEQVAVLPEDLAGAPSRPREELPPAAL